ncbi:MAG TPA: DUF418 domain-containing protein [Sulfurimonas sp.]|nr:DUF418 domain-containing protein [Sulfurimonas sp.]
MPEKIEPISKKKRIKIFDVLYVFQIIFSMICLKLFNFSPLEWLCRCLTYKQLFPIMVKK